MLTTLFYSLLALDQTLASIAAQSDFPKDSRSARVAVSVHFI